MLYKKCRVCSEMKEVVEFHKKKNSPDGHRNECKECVKIIQKRYSKEKGEIQVRTQARNERLYQKI